MPWGSGGRGSGYPPGGTRSGTPPGGYLVRYPPGGSGYPPGGVPGQVPPGGGVRVPPRGGYPVRTTEGVLTTRRAVCLLRSRRRTFLYLHCFNMSSALIHCGMILLVNLFYPQGNYFFLNEIAQIYFFFLRNLSFRMSLYEKEIGWIIKTLVDLQQVFKDTLKSYLCFILIGSDISCSNFLNNTCAVPMSSHAIGLVV